MDFVSNLWESIFTPGTTPTLVKATHGSFVALEITLIGMLIATKSLHFVALLVLATGLWIAITWFINESARLNEQASKACLVDVDAKEITEKASREIEPSMSPSSSADFSPSAASSVSSSAPSASPSPSPNPKTSTARAAGSSTTTKPRRKKRTV